MKHEIKPWKEEEVGSVYLQGWYDKEAILEVLEHLRISEERTKELIQELIDGMEAE